MLVETAVSVSNIFITCTLQGSDNHCLYRDISITVTLRLLSMEIEYVGLLT